MPLGWTRQNLAVGYYCFRFLPYVNLLPAVCRVLLFNGVCYGYTSHLLLLLYSGFTQYSHLPLRLLQTISVFYTNRLALLVLLLSQQQAWIHKRRPLKLLPSRNRLSSTSLMQMVRLPRLALQRLPRQIPAPVRYVAKALLRPIPKNPLSSPQTQTVVTQESRLPIFSVDAY